jgi:hypothetical protein
MIWFLIGFLIFMAINLSITLGLRRWGIHTYTHYEK